MITAKYILENEAGERFDLTAPANIFLVNVEGLGITTNVTYGDLENGFFHTLYEQTPQNNITGDLVYQNAAYDNYQTLVNWIIRAKALYFCYQPLETEYRRIVKLNYIVKERRTAGGWMKAGISFAPLTPWYLAQPTEIGMGGIEEELSKGYFQDGEASPTIEPVQDLHGYDNPWPGGGGKNLFDKTMVTATSSIGVAQNENGFVLTCLSAGQYLSSRAIIIPFTGHDGETLYLKGNVINSGSNNGFFSARFHDDNGEIKDAGGRLEIYSSRPSHYKTVPTGTTSIRCVIYATGTVSASVNDTTTFSNIMLSLTNSAYSPYSNICPITPGLTLVRDDESTLEVYGGTLDVATGTLTATSSVVDAGDITWSATSWGGWRSTALADMATVDPGVISTLVAERYKTVANTDIRTELGLISTGSSSNVKAIFVNDTVAPVGRIVYPLETPVTYQLTTAEVNRALDALGGSYGYRYTDDLRYGGDAAGTMSATIAPSGHVPAAVVLRYTGAITNPRVRLVGAETGIVYGICAINTSFTSGQTFELSTRYEDSHVMLIDGDGTETSLLGYVNQAYETYFRCPTTESAVLTIESDNAFSGEATLLVYTYFGSV